MTNNKLTIKSVKEIQEIEYPAIEWKRKIASIQKNSSASVSSSVLILRASTELLREIFLSKAADIANFEAQNQKLLTFDVKIVNAKTNLEQCFYTLSYEYFDTKSVENIALPIQKILSADLENISDDETKEIAMYYDKNDWKDLDINTQKEIKKWYKNDIFARFFNDWSEVVFNTFDINVSKEAFTIFENSSNSKAKIHGIKNSPSIVKNIIKKYALIVKMQSIFDRAKTNEVNNLLKFADIHIKANYMIFDNEDDKKEYLKDWVLSVIYGKKLIAKYNQTLFKKVMMFR
ncbi:hypothetical protein [Mycoplasmopsis primatum]|uniref:hypothetical protein n=1 Tax=Mycoplasmopsis primatum TaxID=55604 RepID=UPI0004960B29|nr:hypothetical protein [Mycoplasmopsis primatum]